MAAKQKVNKSQAVRDYLKTHPKAMSSEIAAALTKQGIKITPAHVATIKTKAKAKRSARKVKAKAAAAIPIMPTTAAVEKPTKPGETITLEQIKKVAQTVKTIGGFDRLKELLEVVREVGGLKKFKDLLDAMSVTHTDDIPF